MISPNIIILFADQMRADTLGCAGHPIVKTPHLDALAKNGVLFTNTYTPAPSCVPARASLTTGNYPHKATGYKGNTGYIKDDELKLAGYEASVLGDTQKTINNAWVKFPGLMYEAGISALKLQNFSIKIEIDTNPPEGAILKTDIVNKYFPLSFLSYDTASLFAGKLHAILTRKYTKGRDLFDLGWYLSKWKGLSPNIHLLRNALTQTKWVGTLPTENTWRELIYETIANVEWNKAKEDVLNFLENPKDLEIFSQENVLALVKAGAFEPKRG